MAGLVPSSCNVNMTCVLQHPCLFKARPCVQLRLKHYSRLGARRRCRPTRAISNDGGMFEPHKPRHFSGRLHSGRNSRSAEQDTSTEQKPFILKLLDTMRQVSLAALVILLGLGRALSAHARSAFLKAVHLFFCSNQSSFNLIMPISRCSVASPPEPVATVMAEETVRHGETVFSEAGISNSAEGRCRDTGIQLAAAPPNVPGTLLTTVCFVVYFDSLLAKTLLCYSSVLSKASS